MPPTKAASFDTELLGFPLTDAHHQRSGKRQRRKTHFTALTSINGVQLLGGHMALGDYGPFLWSSANHAFPRKKKSVQFSVCLSFPIIDTHSQARTLAVKRSVSHRLCHHAAPQNDASYLTKLYLSIGK